MSLSGTVVYPAGNLHLCYTGNIVRGNFKPIKMPFSHRQTHCNRTFPFFIKLSLGDTDTVTSLLSKGLKVRIFLVTNSLWCWHPIPHFLDR